MRERRPLLKPLWKLTASDFERHPLWVAVHGVDEDEPWYDATDESAVRPFTGPVPAVVQRSPLFASAALTLADGREFPGYATPVRRKTGARKPGKHAIGDMQPRLFAKGRQHSFWGGLAGIGAEERKAFFNALGNGPAAVFPIRFELAADLVCGANVFTSGSIEGFYRMAGPRDIRVDRAAVPELEESVAAEPSLYELLAAASDMSAEGRHDEAVALARRLARANPDDADCHEELALLCFEQGDRRKALAELSKSVACEPNDPSRYVSAGGAALLMEEWETAAALATRGLDAKGDRASRDMHRQDLWFLRARALHALGRHAEALEWLDKVWPGYEQVGSVEDPLLCRRGLVKACRAALASAGNRSRP